MIPQINVKISIINVKIEYFNIHTPKSSSGISLCISTIQKNNTMSHQNNKFVQHAQYVQYSLNQL